MSLPDILVKVFYMMCRQWADAVEARSHATHYKLETELSGYKTNLIKESIRMGHHDIADFFYERGDLQVLSLLRANPACENTQVFNACDVDGH